MRPSAPGRWKRPALFWQVAAAKTEGGWVVIGAALGKQLARDMDGAFVRCRRFIASTGVWYATDILGKRVLGPALVADLEPALVLLAPWRNADDRRVRRAVGVFWVKRSKGAIQHRTHAETILSGSTQICGVGQVSIPARRVRNPPYRCIFAFVTCCCEIFPHE
ncbi:MAG TPA: hypothetical protein ENN99_05690, partial [Chloroflexi bacterium]|nr:hypothetical protein [Chloroflexota bacterium]